MPENSRKPPPRTVFRLCRRALKQETQKNYTFQIRPPIRQCSAYLQRGKVDENVKPSNSEAEAERLLILRTRRGSPEALADLVQMHSPRIYNWSLRILKRHEDAEDNTQNVLCKMYSRINTFKGHSRLSTWLYRVTINEALMEKRRSRPYLAEFGASESDTDGNCLQDFRDRRPDPEQQYVAKELLARALLGLQPSLAEIFMRHKGEGWTQRELADKMGISVAALKAYIFVARKRMLAGLQRLC
jgi:RNA polymerase sigma factor (sigma-70 family)